MGSTEDRKACLQVEFRRSAQPSLYPSATTRHRDMYRRPLPPIRASSSQGSRNLFPLARRRSHMSALFATSAKADWPQNEGIKPSYIWWSDQFTIILEKYRHTWLNLLNCFTIRILSIIMRSLAGNINFNLISIVGRNAESAPAATALEARGVKQFSGSAGKVRPKKS